MALAFSHMGIFVQDIRRMSAFYTDILGMVETDRGALGAIQLVFLSADPAEHHQMVLATGRPEGIGFNTVNQISFRAGSLDELRALHRMIEAEPDCSELIPITHGVSWSVYFRDPEGNRIEAFVDSPFYINQPVREPLDLMGLDDDAILAATEQRCRQESSFMLASEWRAQMVEKLGRST